MSSTLLSDCLGQAVIWTRTEQAEFPYLAEINGQSWQLRINNFPEENLYTLFIENQEIGSFDEWSLAWQR